MEAHVPRDSITMHRLDYEDGNHDRRLQEVGPCHIGTKFDNMFLNGDRWQNDVDFAGSAFPTKIGWMNDYMYFGDESRTQDQEEYKQTFTVAEGVYNGYSSGLRIWHEYDYSQSHARAQFMIPKCIGTCHLATVNIYGSGIRQMFAYHQGNFTTTLDDQFENAAAARYVPTFPRYIVSANQVQRLLNGLKGTIAESYISFQPVSARIVTRNQIRIDFSGLQYVHRVFENKYSRFTHATSFASLHNGANGANNPPFSKCRKDFLGYTSPDPEIPDESEVAFCCNGQCTHDVSTKAWASYGCELTVDNCYNVMLESCAPQTKRCMQLIADPEDQYPSYREPLPHKSLWVWTSDIDMTGGGGVDDDWQRWVRNNAGDPVEYTIIEGHHTIPFTNPGFGNGNYEVTFMLKQGDLINQASLPLVKLTIYSNSVNAVLHEEMLTCGDIPFGQIWAPVTMEVVMADRHLADLSFRIEMKPNTNTQVGYDFVRVKYLEYDTLPPTTSPSFAPTMPKRHNKILAPDGAANDRFGFAVDTNGSLVVVGAEQDDDGSTNSGSIYVYSTNGSFIRKIIAPDNAPGAQFGYSVAMSDSHIVVGSFDHDQQGTDAGAAYLFTTSGSFVRLMLCPSGAANDRCGASVAINGEHILIGAPFSDIQGTDSGAAYYFLTTTGYQRRIVPSDGSAGDRFGISVAVSGSTLIVGADLDDPSGTDSGSVYFFTTAGSMIKRVFAIDAEAGAMFGRSVAASSSHVVVGAPFHAIESSVNVGKVYVLTVAGDLVTHFNAPDWQEGDQFGFSVDISEDRIVVGAYHDDDFGVDGGSVYVFSVSGDFIEKLSPERGSDGNKFGIDVAVSDSTLVVGSSLDDDMGADSGSVYIYFDSEAPTPNPTSIPTATPPCDVPVRVDILTDQYPQETTWTITDPSNNVVLSSTSYTVGSTWHYTNGCVDYATTYTFTINDSSSDGICCQYGEGGYYVMMNEDTNYVISNPNNAFGATASYNFFSGLGSLQNRALGGTAVQSCISSGGDASRAIDNNTDGLYDNGSVTHTCNMQGAAWRVDLPSRTNIRFIEIWNRSDDCCKGRLSNADVEILDANGTMVTSKYIGDMSASTYISFEFPHATFGYKVRVKLRGADVLSLAEVKVWGIEAL